MSKMLEETTIQHQLYIASIYNRRLATAGKSEYSRREMIYATTLVHNRDKCSLNINEEPLFTIAFCLANLNFESGEI